MTKMDKVHIESCVSFLDYKGIIKLVYLLRIIFPRCLYGRYFRFKFKVGSLMLSEFFILFDKSRGVRDDTETFCERLITVTFPFCVVKRKYILLTAC